jgi:hypothetical protein
VIIIDLEHLESTTEIEGTLTGGVYARADAITSASPGQGYAGAVATAVGNQTTSFTYTTVKIYNSGASAITDASGNAYARAQSGNSSSRAYDNSISFSITN